MKASNSYQGYKDLTVWGPQERAQESGTWDPEDGEPEPTGSCGAWVQGLGCWGSRKHPSFIWDPSSPWQDYSSRGKAPSKTEPPSINSASDQIQGRGPSLALCREQKNSIKRKTAPSRKKNLFLQFSYTTSGSQWKYD